MGAWSVHINGGVVSTHQWVCGRYTSMGVWSVHINGGRGQYTSMGGVVSTHQWGRGQYASLEV